MQDIYLVQRLYRMGYMHINNLYKYNPFLQFKRCYALEKIHGTSANITFKYDTKQVLFHHGGAKREEFLNIFDENKLKTIFENNFTHDVIIYGEAYGGKMQKMSSTYGDKLKFIAFDVLIDNETWLTVPESEAVVKLLDLEFVYYKEINTTTKELDIERDADSVQAIRNGCGTGKIREGVVLRPLVELKNQFNERVMAKHKRQDFSECKTPRQTNPEELQVLTNAKDIAEEWVTEMRLNHVLDKIEDKTIGNMGNIIKAMISDIYREGKGEIVESKSVEKAIGKKTVEVFKRSIFLI